jgi:hypothetical protein
MQPNVCTAYVHPTDPFVLWLTISSSFTEKREREREKEEEEEDLNGICQYRTTMMTMCQSFTSFLF